MRLSLAAAFVLGFATLAQAQTPLTGTTGAPTAPPPNTSAPAPARRTRQTMPARFDAANTPHDGHLTLAQAQSGMPMVARNFAAIDTQNKGYVTMDEIRAYNRARRAERAAKSQ